MDSSHISSIAVAVLHCRINQYVVLRTILYLLLGSEVLEFANYLTLNNNNYSKS